MTKLKLILSLFFSAILNPLTHATAIDISGQSISAFLQEGNYAEISYGSIDTQVRGEQKALNSQDTMHKIDAHNHMLSMSFKKKINPNLSFGLLYDQPFQLDSDYYEQHKNAKEYLPNQLNSHIDTENLTFLTGYQSNSGLGFFAGPVYQHLRGNFKIAAQAYGSAGHYKNDFQKDDALGYVVGVNYNLDKLHLKMDLSYRSEIKHDLDIIEKIDFPLIFQQPIQSFSQSKLNTPESINLNLQMAVYHNTLLMLNSRWVNWNTFKLTADLFSKASAFIESNNNLNSGSGALLKYNKDQWSLNLGLARKLSDQWAGFIFAGYDTGDSFLNNNTRANNWLTGLIVQYNIMQKYEFNAGIVYIKLEDSTQTIQENTLSKSISTHNFVEYSDNNALAYLFKLGYRF